MVKGYAYYFRLEICVILFEAGDNGLDCQGIFNPLLNVNILDFTKSVPEVLR